ncbi:MAG: hypothetical protein GY870_20250 [archaeon]|nr:hypothetical protein [archaeon]
MKKTSSNNIDGTFNPSISLRNYKISIIKKMTIVEFIITIIMTILSVIFNINLAHIYLYTALVSIIALIFNKFEKTTEGIYFSLILMTLCFYIFPMLFSTEYLLGFIIILMILSSIFSSIKITSVLFIMDLFFLSISYVIERLNSISVFIFSNNIISLLSFTIFTFCIAIGIHKILIILENQILSINFKLYHNIREPLVTITSFKELNDREFMKLLNSSEQLSFIFENLLKFGKDAEGILTESNQQDYIIQKLISLLNSIPKNFLEEIEEISDKYKKSIEKIDKYSLKIRDAVETISIEMYNISEALNIMQKKEIVEELID